MPGLEKLPSGKWRWTVQRNGLRYADTRNARAAARSFALDLEDLIDNGHVVDHPKGTHPAKEPPPGVTPCCRPPDPPRSATTTFGAWRQTWWEAVGPTREPSTRAKNESLVRNHIGPRWDGHPLGAIVKSDVQAWVNDLRRGRLAASSVVSVHALLVEILTAAVGDGILAANPARGVTLPRDDADEVLTLDDLGMLLDLVGLFDARDGLLVLAGGLSGLRWSELLGLRVDDWTGSSLAVLPPTRRVIRGPLVEVRGHFGHKAPKSEAGERLVPVIGPLAGLLDVLAEARHSGRPCEECGRPHLFVAAQGGPHRRSTFGRRTWAPRAEQVRPGVTFKGATRHFHESIMEQWVPEAARRRRLGHAIPGMGRVYGHDTPDMQALVLSGWQDRWEQAVSVPERRGWWCG